MNRSEQFEKLTSDRSQPWDVVVIGGGATGLAIAMDASSRGYSVVLVEASDFAEGTSSKSTKLIHGGVRYLRGGEVSLVREALHERGRLLKNAPNLVKPLPVVVPAYRWYDRFYYGTGLSLYDLLAGDLGINSTGHYSLGKTCEVAPNLNRDGLRGGTYFWDAQFDDARLAIAMARTAVDHDAVVLNYTKVTRLLKNSADRISGVIAQDLLGDQELEIHGRVVINATGVFTDSIRQLDEADTPAVITPSQGIHIVLDQKFLGSGTGIMIPETDDGRVLFAIPWHNRVLLGTTDTPGVPIELDPRPLEDEVSYLIEHAGRYLASAPSYSDIRATYAGLRPLVKPTSNTTGKTSKISRKHSLFVSDSGLVTMTGGKWTTCRAMAETAVERAIKVGGLEHQPCTTRDLKLHDQSAAQELTRANQTWAQNLHDDLPYTQADVLAAVRFEAAETLDDVLARRTRCRILDREASLAVARPVAEIMADEKGKDETWVEQQVNEFSSKVEPSSILT